MELQADLYDRQKRIPDWNQDTLTDSIATVIGSNYLALETLTPLAAMGFGTVVACGNEITGLDEKVINIPLEPGKPRVLEWEKAFKKIFQNIDFIPLLETVNSEGLADICRADVVADTTNDPGSKINAAEFCKKNSIPLILGASMPGYLKLVPAMPLMEFNNNYPLHDFEGMFPDEFLSVIGGGMIAEEMKKCVFKSDFVMTEPLYFKIGNKEIFGYKTDEHFSGYPKFKGKRALVIGNGALLASGAGRILARQGYESIDLMDYKRVDPTNLNRQILHHGQIGNLKPISAKSAMETITPGLKINYIIGKVEEGFRIEGDYDVVFDWVDNLYTRALISVACIEKNIPLITAATDYKSGEWATYAPGKTKCMDCYFGIHSLGAAEERERRETCLAAPDASIITSNQITGSASALAAGSLFYPEIFGQPINGVLKYSSTREKKFGVTKFEDVCDCHTKKVKDIKV